MVNRDKTVLYPPFAEKLLLFEEGLIEAGLSFYLFEGYRSHERQAELYAQGRTTPGTRVTNARPGQSIHQYACAADYVLDGMPDKPGIQWSWDMKKDLNADGRGDWLQMAEIAVKTGLEAGLNWKSFPDAPHVQLASPLTINELQALYAEGGLARVWAALDLYII
jgi:peptidoglycan LD-endopeptidase CwlK